MVSMELPVNACCTCDLPDENRFVFCRLQALGNLRGSDVIQQLPRDSGTHHPEAHGRHVQGSQYKEDDETDQLVDSLGHNITNIVDRLWAHCGRQGWVKFTWTRVSCLIQGMKVEQININPWGKQACVNHWNLSCGSVDSLTLLHFKSKWLSTVDQILK